MRGARIIHQHKPDSEDLSDARKKARQVFNAAYGATLGVLLIGIPVLMVWLGLRLPGWYFSLCIFHVALAQGLATLACRTAGVSQEGLRYEVIERDARAALAPYISGAPEFEVKELWLRQIKVDREGIEAKHSDGKWKRIEWREVETCTFSAPRNAIGNYIGPSLMLQGSEELPLLHSTPPSRDVDRLLEAIRFYLRAESTDDATL